MWVLDESPYPGRRHDGPRRRKGSLEEHMSSKTELPMMGRRRPGVLHAFWALSTHQATDAMVLLDQARE